jgi:hypothetical protein
MAKAIRSEQAQAVCSLRRISPRPSLAEAVQEIARETGRDLQLDLRMRAGKARQGLRQDDGGVVIHHREPDTAADALRIDDVERLVMQRDDTPGIT